MKRAKTNWYYQQTKVLVSKLKVLVSRIRLRIATAYLLVSFFFGQYNILHSLNAGVRKHNIWYN